MIYLLKALGFEAEILPEKGADILSLRYQGRDIYFPLKSEKEREKNPFLHGAPLLLPSNRTYEGSFTFEGKKYSLPINEPKNNAHLHGMLYNQPFVVKQYSEKFIEMEYTNNNNIYPFAFYIDVRYEITDLGFEQHYTIKNIGTENMPFTFGLHATFKEPDVFMLPINSCQEKNGHHIPTGRYVDLNNLEKTFISCGKSKNNIISGYYRSCGNIAFLDNLKYTVSDNFDHWVLYNAMGKADLICIEPQCGAVNGLNTDNGYGVLKPTEYEKFYTLITPFGRKG